MGKKRDIAEPLVPGLPAGTPSSPEDRGFAACMCPKTKCELRGDCLPCAAYHGRKGSLPRCAR